MIENLARRAFTGLTVRASAAAEGFIGVLEGYAAVFNSDSEEFASFGKPWVERIAPGAFARSLKERPDVRALWAHDSSRVLARAPDTLRLSEDEKGLRAELHLIDTQQNRDALASVRAGLVDAMSFGFVPKVTEWEEGKERDLRTVKDLDLFEVSVVAWPAYAATSIGARSLDACAKAAAEERDQFLSARTGASKVNLAAVWAQRARTL